MSDKRIKTSLDKPERIVSKEYEYCSFANGEVFEEKQVGRLPMMGWNSWNAFGSNNTEELTRKMADRIVELGLDKLGYKYVVLDDGCYAGERVNGRLCSNPETFPSGFGAMGDYIHQKGLKFGMYNDIGVRLCSGLEVGTCGHEDIDAEDYVNWNIDFIKVDNCYYLWDNATFSNPENAQYVYAPRIKSIQVQAAETPGSVIRLDACTEGIVTGSGASISDEGYVSGIGTLDGTGIENSPLGELSSELVFKVDVPAAGNYTVTIEYASGHEVGCGRWLQLVVGCGDRQQRVFDDFLEETESTDTYAYSQAIAVVLEEGVNEIRIMNHRRQENVFNAYATMFNALNAAKPNNDIVLSVCEWGKTQPHNWAYKIADSWRILNDITFAVGDDGNPGSATWEKDYTDSITSQYNKAVIMDECAGKQRGWNDPDMLVIGMNGLDETMNRTHMAMWCMMNSPLMLGMDLRRVEKGDMIYNIITNRGLIAINQDELGVQAKRIFTSITDERPDRTYITNNERVDVLAKPLENGDVALMFGNLSNEDCSGEYAVDKSLVIRYIGDKMRNCKSFDDAESYEITDVWDNSKSINTDGVFRVKGLKAHDNYTIRISPR